MRQCIFCENPADSREHYVPDWILQSINIKVEVARSVGDFPPVWFSNPRQNMKVRSVCEDCNLGWMTTLEQESKPIISPFLHGSDVATPMDRTQQSVIARWAVKTAMVGETIAPPPPKIGRYFYTRDECERLRLTSSLPRKTAVWLGKFSGLGLFGRGTHVWDNAKGNPIQQPGIHGHIFTLVLNHLTIQVLTVHVLPEDDTTSLPVDQNDAPCGDWNDLTVTVWPILGTVWYPPTRIFSESETCWIGALLNRFKVGRKA
jgi:hypothetical protein